MNSIGRISHDNKIIDRKVKYFYDYFHYYLSSNEYLLLRHQPVESHLSLLHKIKNRLEEGKIEPSTNTIVNALLGNELLVVDLDIISRKGKVKETIRSVKDSYNKQDIGIDVTLSKIDEAIACLNGLNDDGFIGYCTNGLISYLGCPHELEEHEQEIKYFTKLIVAEFVRENYSIKELTKPINGLFRKVLLKSSDVKHTFKEQFKTIVTEHQRETTSTFIVRVSNVSVLGGISIKYGDVEIVSKANLGIQTNIDTDTIILDFINSDDYLYLRLNKSFKSFDDVVSSVFKDADDTISYLSYPKQQRGVLDRSKILEVNGDKIGWRYERDILSISNDVNYILDNKIDSTSPIYDELFGLEKIYFNAFTSHKIKDKLLYAWRYLERLTKSLSLNDGKRIKKLSSILLNDELKFTKQNLSLLLIDLVINNNEVLNSTIDRNELNNLEHSNDNDVKFIKDNTEYYFTNTLIKEYENLSIDYQAKFNVYKYNISYLYEQRNLIIHKADICNISIELFASVIHVMIKRIRMLVLNDVNKNGRESIVDSLNHLINEGNALKSPRGS